MLKTWDIVSRLPSNNSAFETENLVKLLLENRGIKSKKEIEAFLHPQLGKVTPKSVGIDAEQLKKTIARIEKAIENKEQIVVFGDYDVDGITASAILWETLHELGANCLPYIPNRKGEGYGLSITGIKNLALGIKDTKLIITVDNGIVANDAVLFANESGIDVIITDHHTVGETLPEAFAIVHTTKLCGAGVAYLLSKELQVSNKKALDEDRHLELAALGTVADLVPLTGANRAIVYEGLKKLQVSKRPGLLALFQQAKVKQGDIGVYEIGYIIGPRLNAAGRIDSAMDSLRLLCTTNMTRAQELAAKLESVNRERQQLLKEATEHAIAQVEGQQAIKSILIIGHEDYAEGIIGLIAGRLVEAFYRPAIVLSIGETTSKASVRSISGFNIIEFLRLYIEHFINVGGHPMAAGFTVETAKIALLQKMLEEKAAELLTEVLLTRTLKIDCELPFNFLTKEVYENIQQLAPFGMGNPEPVLASKGVTVGNLRIIGKEKNHLKLVLKQDSQSFDAIAFGMGELVTTMRPGDTVDVAYVLDENTWNGETKLQLKVRDIKLL